MSSKEKFISNNNKPIIHQSLASHELKEFKYSTSILIGCTDLGDHKKSSQEWISYNFVETIALGVIGDILSCGWFANKRKAKKDQSQEY